MLNQMAEDSETPLNQHLRRRQKQGGIAVQDLGYNVIFTGGERTLEKNLEALDVQRFDLEADPLFR